jgi:hypothetical protein
MPEQQNGFNPSGKHVPELFSDIPDYHAGDDRFGRVWSRGRRIRESKANGPHTCTCTESPCPAGGRASPYRGQHLGQKKQMTWNAMPVQSNRLPGSVRAGFQSDIIAKLADVGCARRRVDPAYALLRSRKPYQPCLGGSLGCGVSLFVRNTQQAQAQQTMAARSGYPVLKAGRDVVPPQDHDSPVPGQQSDTCRRGYC